jgi:hypothetical protein
MMKPLTHFFFTWAGQGTFLLSLGFGGTLVARIFLAFLPAVDRVEACLVGVQV